MRRSFILVSGLGFLASAHANAQTAPASEAFTLITKVAAEICTKVDQNGREASAQLNGEVNAKLSSVWTRIAALGVKLGIVAGSENYEGLPREALEVAIKNHDDCGLKVLYFLVDKTGFAAATSSGASVRWVNIGVIGDWGGKDYAHTGTAIPKYKVGGTILCDEQKTGHVAVCWEGRPNGYPVDDLTDVPAGERPSEWCAYKNNLITISTARDGRNPGRLYVCARSVPP